MLRISASSQRIILTVIAIFTIISSASAQSKKKTLWAKTDSILSVRYNKGDIDTAYITRPTQKWAIIGRLNFSGQQIETEGIDEGTHFKAKMNSDYKTTASVAVRYLGVTLSVALNPTKLWGKYKDYELNFNSYGKRFGFDVIYHESKNFKGWHDFEGMERIKLPANMLSVKTLKSCFRVNHL